MEVELTIKQYGKLSRAFKAINDVRSEVQQSYPNRNIVWYDTMGSVHLLDDTADGNEGKNVGDVIDTFYIDYCDCGDW